MEKDSPIAIGTDTVRRMRLNAERNSRKTVCGEATQTLNPLTGRPYEFILECERYPIKNIPTMEDVIKDYYLKFPSLSRPKLPRQTTNETTELQKALGRMEVRERKLSEFDYLAFVRDVRELAEAYAQNPALTLDSITDVNGLNTALWAIQRERKPKFFENTNLSAYIFPVEKKNFYIPILTDPTKLKINHYSLEN